MAFSMEMAGWHDASYFYPPAIDAAPSWVLLNNKARYTDCCDDNASTAYAITSAGRTLKATFCLASPPAVSHVSVHYTDSRPEDSHYVHAEVSSSAKDLALLRLSSRQRKPGDAGDYFVYHAPAGKPSLRAIPCLPISPEAPCFSYDYDITPPCGPCVSLLPFDNDDGGGGEFLLASLTAIDCRATDYDLHVFSSKTCAWSTRRLKPPVGVRNYVFDKVIALGGSMLGWVDLRLGGCIVACDVLDEDPAATRFIPLPNPDFHKSTDQCRLPAHRDVACYVDGFIVLVDLDLRSRYVARDRKDEAKRVIKAIKDLDHANVIRDSELSCDDDHANVDLVPDGWKIRTCYSHISWDYWRTGRIVDADDITVCDPKHSTMLPELWDDGAERWTTHRAYVRPKRSNRPRVALGFLYCSGDPAVVHI
jgi:hypothetical protein